MDHVDAYSQLYTVVTGAGRPNYVQEFCADLEGAWPVIANQNPNSGKYWGPLTRGFAEFQFALADPATGAYVAVGSSIPVLWEGDLADLPEEGWDWAMVEGITGGEAGRTPNMLCALSITIPLRSRGKGISYHAVRAMCDIARAQGFRDLIVPTRPSLKHRYPLTPIARYVTWTTNEGLPFDPWLRVHARLGGRIIKPCPRSETTIAPIADFEKWTGMVFPESGSYIVRDGMVPVEIDRESGLGTYIEPNVWMHHDLSAT
jgi:hypothetical protein